jgi:hypothetical protein
VKFIGQTVGRIVPGLCLPLPAFIGHNPPLEMILLVSHFLGWPRQGTVVTAMCHCYFWPLHLDFYDKFDQCKHSLMAPLHESIISH